MRFTIFSFLLLLAFTANARTVRVGDFNQIKLWGNVHVLLMAADEPRIDIEDGFEDVDIEVSGGVLKIKRDKPLNFDSYDSPPVEVIVHYQKFYSLRAAAGARVEAHETLTGDQMSLEFVSGAEGMLEMEVNDTKINVASGARLRLRGNAYSQNTKVASGGILRAGRFYCKRSYIKSTTGGEADIVADQTLEARASTGGMITFDGNPEVMKIKDTLGGEVRGL